MQPSSLQHSLLCYTLIDQLLMSSSTARRPPTTIEAFCCSNCQDEQGHWSVETFKRWDWVTMQPSMRGAHKVSRRHIGERSHHWKGRIVELKQTIDGKKLAKVQHVYKATQLKLANNGHQRYPTNCKSSDHLAIHWCIAHIICFSL